MTLLPPPLVAPADPPWGKLLLRDDQERCLLVRFRRQWEVPGTELPWDALASEASCAAFLARFAHELGASVSAPRLAASVVQHFARGTVPTPFLWFTGAAEPADPQQEVETIWLSLSEALEAVPYPSGKRILEQIARWPERLIVGEYEVDYSVDPPGGRLRVIRPIVPQT